MMNRKRLAVNLIHIAVLLFELRIFEISFFLEPTPSHYVFHPTVSGRACKATIGIFTSLGHVVCVKDCDIIFEIIELVLHS